MRTHKRLFSIQQRSNYVFITSLVHFISDQESGRAFNRLSNRTLRRFVALTTVSPILNISSLSTVCLILNDSEHNMVTFSPISGSRDGRPRAPRSTSSRRPSVAHGANMSTAVAAARARRRLVPWSGGGVCAPAASARLGPRAPAAARLHCPALSTALAGWMSRRRRGDVRPRWRGRRRRRRRGRRLSRAPSAVSFRDCRARQARQPRGGTPPVGAERCRLHSVRRRVASAAGGGGGEGRDSPALSFALTARRRHGGRPAKRGAADRCGRGRTAARAGVRAKRGCRVVGAGDTTSAGALPRGFTRSSAGSGVRRRLRVPPAAVGGRGRWRGGGHGGGVGGGMRRRRFPRRRGVCRCGLSRVAAPGGGTQPHTLHCSRRLGRRRRGGLLAKSCDGRPRNRGGRARRQPSPSGTAARAGVQAAAKRGRRVEACSTSSRLIRSPCSSRIFTIFS